jgi:putative nucleotidyltransferase with HDIG domain
MVLAQDFRAALLEDLHTDRLTLPTLPEVALRVQAALEDPDISAGQLAETLASDAALSARLIKVANSAAFRGRTPADSLRAAITRLGMSVVRRLTTGLAMQQMFQATTDATDRLLREVWEHSTQVAAISQVLARHFTRLKPDEALLAGLVHDIGKLPIITWAEREPRVLEDEAVLEQLLTQLHTEVGRSILEAWAFPPELVAVAAEHEQVQRTASGGPDYVDVVLVANLQSHLGGPHPLGQTDCSQVSAFGRLGLAADTEIGGMDPEIQVEITEVEQIFLG